MKNSLLLIAVILFSLFVSSCQKKFLDPNPPASRNYDADALRFIDSTGIIDTTQKSALNNLVSQLKDSSLWSKFIAIYPMVGGSASTTKWNLIDPRDNDSAFRLTFYGNPVYSSGGVLFPTLSDYADTHLNDSILIYNNNSISYYSGTQNTINGYDIGCTDSGFPANEIAIYNTSDAANWFGYYDFGPKPSNTKGLFLYSSTVSDVTRYENGAFQSSKGGPPNPGFTGYSILIGEVLNAPSGGQKQCQLATIGRGLSNAEALTFYNIVQNFETKLGR